MRVCPTPGHSVGLGGKPPSLLGSAGTDCDTTGAVLSLGPAATISRGMGWSRALVVEQEGWTTRERADREDGEEERRAGEMMEGVEGEDEGGRRKSRGRYYREQTHSWCDLVRKGASKMVLTDFGDCMVATLLP